MNPSFQSGHPNCNPQPTDIDGWDALTDLALDLRSTWNHATDTIWRDLDRELWESTHNPWVVLQTVSRRRIEEQLNRPAFRETLDALIEARRQAQEESTWFQQEHPDSPLTRAAYFSMEFMLSEALPIYSGGLGNVAGDQLKAVSDLGVPVVGVGLLYQQGYFRQTIDGDGMQQALFPYNDPGQLPITPLRRADGEWLRLEIALPGYSVWLRAWQAQVGGVKLYLLDSNDAANYPAHRSITSELYGGDAELRLKQELVLGIGGWRLLEALDIAPEVCHLNEGHAAFAVLERARSFMKATGHSFEVALAATRAGNLFTTHTAVTAGFDRFSPELIRQYLGPYATKMLGIEVDDLLALGRQGTGDDEMFNMAYLAIRGSGAINGVSRLHGTVSRRIFEPLFPQWPEAEIPVGHVTNGVHMPSWDSAAADRLWTEICGKDRWRKPCDSLSEEIRKVSDPTLWQFRIESSKSLVEFARQRLSRDLAVARADASDVEAAKHLFDPHALTLGFARRFATYKRPNLLLHDPDRLLRLLSDPERPVQLILAGKAHPADTAGQELLRQWVQFIRHPTARKHVIFLCDYDMLMTERLVQGVDVWINTPRRPWEASGTSGMKVLVNGGINLSELDGWWVEAYKPELGWALGDGREHGDDPAWDAAEAEQLYELLENEVIPEFYARDEQGIPTAWLQRMRNSMATLTPEYSAIRTVRQYTQQHYLPAAQVYRERVAYNGQLATSIVNWETSVKEKWSSLRFGRVDCRSDNSEHQFEVEVYLDGLDPSFVQVELYAEPTDGPEPRRVAMQPQATRDDDDGTRWAIYRGGVPSSDDANDYTARVLPVHEGVAIPLELNLILWQR
ncbi:Maltodextrin phosphorylase [Rosistilla ulvae]|uniref:Maltodextrin phosphorylase n=1 Tax=Rosistilla ulvae TaxID=1930277 RepID=A0A517M111_9BACT|nr:alpha-glucan family phosphorylase [Rosistilla ulvae]QDS88567.1 Maltodextrin phosphorylase [Rosistilla ulvae]